MAVAQLTHARVYFIEKGQGTPLLFLNGLSSDHGYWLGQLRAFAAEQRCIAFDNRDVGQSVAVTVEYTIADLADDVAEFMEHLALPPAHVVGLSMGGMVAQELAISRPERVRSLSLVCTLATADDWFRGTLQAFELIRRQVGDTPCFFEAILPWWVSHRFYEQSERPEWLRWLLRQNPHPQPLEGFVRQLQAIRRHDTAARLASVKCPVHVVAGADDAIIPLRYSRQLCELLPQGRLTVLDGVGHAPPLEAPRPFNKAIQGFLATA